MTDKQIGYIVVAVLICVVIGFAIYCWELAKHIRATSPLNRFTVSSDGTVAERVAEIEPCDSPLYHTLTMDHEGNILEAW